MITDISWLLFVIASVAVILTPGQDMVLVMSRSISQGAFAGVATAAGVSTGLLLHTVLATLGVGAIVMASEVLFFAMKIAGALYLLYLGVSLLRLNSTDLHTKDSARRSTWKLYCDGVFSNVANPKIAIFYFAFLPQFVLPGADKPTAAIFILGACFAALTFVIKGPAGYFSGHLSNWFRRKPAGLLAIYRVSGLTLIGLGVRLALERQN